ncbi:hypothetical protein CROQUDRAFT_44134, partial [Cronartium quercuum f. sp. fusiforme G11]
LYWQILDLQQQLYEEGLGLSVTECYAETCAQCFGLAVGEIKESGKVPDFIVSLDANFQQQHYSYSSKDTPSESDYPSSFLKPSQITKQEDLCKKTEMQGKDIKTACSDSHMAANNLWTAASWRKACDDNGIFHCQHIFITWKLAMLHYPVSLLANLLHEIPHRQVGVLYDIGCHLNVHIKKVLHFLFFSHSCSIQKIMLTSFLFSDQHDLLPEDHD